MAAPTSVTPISVDTGIRLATRHTDRCADLLAANIYPLLNQAAWFTPEWRLKFCAYFLQNMVDQSIEAEVDAVVTARIQRLRLTRALRLLGNSPATGTRVLVAILSQHLRQKQNLSTEQQYRFYETLFGQFFPDSPLKRD
jgi:hypothetical protein